ncbi:MAG: hypothetical protein K2X36_02635 [Microbacteriaceae bacterium]|nr:hypothetical protein [Microbacteriaceae bacterium]
MSAVLRVVGALFALVGGVTLFVALFTPKRYTARRPQRFIIGFGLLGLAVALYSFATQLEGSA